MKTTITLRMDENHGKKYRQMVRGSKSFEVAPTRLERCKNLPLKLSRIDYLILGIVAAMSFMAYFIGGTR